MLLLLFPLTVCFLHNVNVCFSSRYIDVLLTPRSHQEKEILFYDFQCRMNNIYARSSLGKVRHEI